MWVHVSEQVYMVITSMTVPSLIVLSISGHFECLYIRYNYSKWEATLILQVYKLAIYICIIFVLTL